MPLVALHFCLYASRGWPHARAYVLVALSGLVLSALVPLSGYAEGLGKTQSVVLLGVYRVEEMLGVGTGALVVALIAAAGSLLAAALPWFGKRGETVGLAATIALLVGAAVLATSFDVRNTDVVRRSYLPATPNWVDQARLGDVTLLHVAASGTDTLSQLFWNRSLKDVVVLPGGGPPDIFVSRNATIDATGTLRVDGHPLAGAVLADVWAGTVDLRGGHVVAGTSTYQLWRLDGPARLAMYGLGFYRDGWLGARSAVTVWPRAHGGELSGSVSLRLEGPKHFTRPVRIAIFWPGGHRHVVVAPGATVNLVLPVCSQRTVAGAVRDERSDCPRLPRSSACFPPDPSGTRVTEAAPRVRLDKLRLRGCPRPLASASA